MLLQRLKSKTYQLALLLSALGAAQVAWPALAASIPPQYYAWGTLGLGVVVAVLRELTKVPLADK